MFKYHKIKDGSGDFNSFDAGVLYDELVKEIGIPGIDSWVLNTNEILITIHLKDESLDTSKIDKIFRDHFKIDWTDYDPIKEKKDKQKVKLSQCTTIAQLKTFIEEELL